MKKYKIKSVPTRQGAYVRRRIAKNRHRAEFVGIIYLFATIILAALACLPMLTAENAPVGIANVMQVFQSFTLSTVGDLIKLINAALYVLMLLGLVINILRSLANLGNLFKKKVSRVYGLNANLDAMENMGSLFSGSLASIINFHFLIYILAGGATVEMMFLVALGVGLVIHFLCGILSTKTSVFEKDKEVGVREHKRMFSRVLPFFRNLIQTVAVFAMMYIFLVSATLGSYIAALAADNGITMMIENLFNYIPFFTQLLTAIWLMVLVKHATGISEYDFRGPEAEGQHNYRVFAFFTVITALVTFACRMMFGEAIFTLEGSSLFIEIVTGQDMNCIILAAIAFVAFLLDCIVKLRISYADDEEEEDYIDWSSIPERERPARYPMAYQPGPQVRYVKSYMDGRSVEHAPSMPQSRSGSSAAAYGAPVWMNTNPMASVYAPGAPISATAYPMNPIYAPGAPVSVNATATVPPTPPAPPAFIPMPAPAPQPAPQPVAPQPPVFVSVNTPNASDSGEIQNSYLDMMKQQLRAQQIQTQQMQMSMMCSHQLQSQQSRLNHMQQTQQMDAMQEQLQNLKADQEQARQQAWMAGAFGAAASAYNAPNSFAPNNAQESEKASEDEDIMRVAADEDTVVLPSIDNEAVDSVDAEEEEREPRDWQIKCPSCQQPLTVSDEHEYHRCPSCGKVMQLNIKQVNVEVEDEPEAEGEAEAEGEEETSSEE